MRWTLRTMLFLIAISAVVLATGIAFAPEFQGSNCGGNSAALCDVREYSIIVQLAVAESPNKQFDIASATPVQREALNRIANDFWIRPARFLVSPLLNRDLHVERRRIIVVCDRPFTNVPRRIFGSSSPTHAAAFSDGTVGLISVKEFEGLDRSSLVPLDGIFRQSER